MQSDQPDVVSEEQDRAAPSAIPSPPKGLAVFLVLGPGLIWAGEYIGSGEVILATRTGAVLGLAALWVPTLAIFAKFWIGLAGAHYTVCTGEGMIDMMGRAPGSRYWALWPIFIGQICAGALSTGAIVTVASIFAGQLIPWPPYLLGWIITALILALTWSGQFDLLKKGASVLVLIIIIGVFEVARATWPGWGPILSGLFLFQVPEAPEWVQAQSEVPLTAWGEILPLLGWAAGGFASQVWYTYWVLGAGYGMAHGRGYGQPLDAGRLRQVTAATADKLKAWCRVVTLDASIALLIGISVTAAFMIAGAGVLGRAQIAPEGASVAIELSGIFGERWGQAGATLFLLAGLAAMLSTLLGQFAGWPRLLADCGRLLIPGVARYPWKVQFRFVLLCFAASNMLLAYTLDERPVLLVKVSAVLDGLLLTPLQALAVGLTLYWVMPRMFSAEVRRILKPNPVLAVGLVLAFLLFGYFCVFQIPNAFRAG